MSRTRTVDFLPEIFRTPTNRQFLAATLDQLVQEPKFRRREGFIGRTVGPGVTVDDRYVVEPDKTRADYQLEPGVVSLASDAVTLKDAITFTGINDAITQQGGNGSRPDRLYSSEFYTWDPFVDFDSFVNFSQYYWLPNGPDAVTVSSTGIPATDTFTVTRANGAYTFSGVTGTNPTIELLRGGEYRFDVSQNAKQTVNFRVRNIDASAYIIDGTNNPTLTLERGNTYVFNLTLRDNFPFWIKTEPTLGTDNAYNVGVSRNGSSFGLVTFVVPQDAPDTLYYASENQSNMRGTFTIVDAQSGTGPGFWIQTTPGTAGVLPTSPNISNREVFGVNNNGEDLGTVSFNVPSRTAQEFFYNLSVFTGAVDFVTGLRFDQINNQPLQQFLQTRGGIDGVQSIVGRTLVFAETPIETTQGGWQRTSFFDPLDQEPELNGETGSFDTTGFDQTDIIPVPDRTQLWQINSTVLNGVEYLQLIKLTDIPQLNKFTIRYGDVYANTTWYKTTLSDLRRVPLLTAATDTLYYQDAVDPNIQGIIRLIDDTDAETLFIDQILNQQNYTSPNGVVFTNGLKVVFRGSVEPASFGSGSTAILVTSANAQLDALTTSDTSILYVGQELVFSGLTIGGITSGQSYYVQSIINDFQFTVSETPDGSRFELQNGSGNMSGIAISYREFYVSGVGSSIDLLPVGDFVCPESYVVDADDSTVAAEPNEPDYITIDRASLDQNAWSRSNRWFHVDVINATAEYNSTVASPDINRQARRPILQFRPNIRLFNMGIEAKDPVNIIDLTQTDAFSNVQGATSYAIDGYQLVNGSRVIFAADLDPQIRNKIYVVEFITPDTIPPLVAQPFINLTEATDGTVLADQCALVLNGTTLTGTTFWYDGIEWTRAQQKISIQQNPLFDVYDANGISYGNHDIYPSSNFIGSALFSYARSSTSVLDPVLKIPLQYLNIANVGDIVFVNNLYSDSFVYTLDNVSTTLPISQGFVREYSTRTEFDRLIGWQTAVAASTEYQQFKFNYVGTDLEIDITVSDANTLPAAKVYVNNVFLDPGNYSFVRDTNRTVFTILQGAEVGDLIEILALSDQTSRVGFYQVPVNLENNPLNENAGTFTLGTIRQHYQTLCQNLPDIQGNIIGRNNTRDLGNIIPFGLNILQQSAPLTLAGYFLRNQEFNIFDALAFNAREYFKFKNLLLDQVTKQVVNFQTAAQLLDVCLDNLIQGKTEMDPFYWSDMLPSGAVFTELNYTISRTTTDTFDTNNVYDYTSANYQGLNVYRNNTILIRGLDYTVATDGPRIVIQTELALGDRITVREYTATQGSFVPNTPTKIGAYPAWRPEILDINTSSGTQTVIIGHDGSQTKTFGDIRDDVLLEFERRIFNNLKLDGNPVPLPAADVIPGQFRDTGYSFAEISDVLETDFLSYVAWNKLDYRTQNYQANNPFSYNYSTATNKLDGSNLLGAWRGIYRYFYDCEQPHLVPWEMLGFSVKPDWWDTVYGVPFYTSGNLVLWEDIATGYVRDPSGPYTLPDYTRPGLLDVLPVDSQGRLVSPLTSVVGIFDAQEFRRGWQPGDGSPVEASWYHSSLYPFAVMRLLAVTRPAKFFALLADRDRYRYDSDLEQFLYDGRFRLDANGIEVYGNGVSKASYINWIVDYNRQTGLDSTDTLTTDLANLSVRLCYRMASFSDKRFIKILSEKATPDSTNTSLLIPDSSYNLVLYKNQPFETVRYSSVMIQRENGKYAVFGYSTTQPFFQILRSQAGGRLRSISAGGKTVRVPSAFTDQIVNVPYSFEFDTTTAVVDFLLSYGAFLETQGFVFDNIDNGYALTWTQMAQEFLYWTQQGWGDTAILNLNPLATRLQLNRPLAVADRIDAAANDNAVIDQNRKNLPVQKLNITRLDNSITIEPADLQTLNAVVLRYTSYEHMIVMDNRSEFGDLIYDPVTGARQQRLKLIATTTADWNGTVDAQGFVLNQPNVQPWTGTRVYAKGEIVEYKGSFWSAVRIVQPSEIFDQNDWLQSDYDRIEQGLLPNLANKSDQLANSYNIYSANLESENDLFSYGLIGFRPRQYLADINLSDVSQVNVYQQFLGTKGTRQSTDLFTQIDFGKEAADYEIFENWAVQRGVYGANANRSFVELQLDKANLTANPSTVQLVQSGQGSLADQSININHIWRQSFRVNSPDVFPTTLDLPTDTALPNAGYVNLDDADITVFDIRQPGSLDASLDRIVSGATIWAAKVNEYDWNIYRVNSVPASITHVCDNLDSTSLVIFNGQHGLTVGQLIIVRNFDSEVDGVYEVLTVPGLDKITISFAFTGNRTVINAIGLAFELISTRVAQLADAADLPFVNELKSGTRVWVDNDGTGRWSVVQKNDVLSDLLNLAPAVLDATEGYGSAVAQATNKFAALVGSPRLGFGVGPAKGGVYTYVRNVDTEYQPTSPLPAEDAILELDNPGTRQYGAALDFGDRDWAVAGAPGSLGRAGQSDSGYVGLIYRDPLTYLPGTNPYRNWQILVTPENIDIDQGEMGSAVAISQNERWCYVGAPGVNQVYAFARVPWQRQQLQVEADASTAVYNIQNDIQISSAEQIEVLIDDTLQTLDVNYVVDSNNTYVEFLEGSIPAAGQSVEIRRVDTVVIDRRVYLGVLSQGGSGSRASFTVTIQRNTVDVVLQSGGSNYVDGDTLVLPGDLFEGWNSPSNDITFTVAVGTGGTITSISPPIYTGPGLVNTFNIGDLFFQVSLPESSIFSFQIEADIVLLRPNIDYTFDAGTKNITFSNPPVAGAEIVVRARDYWQYVDTLTVPGNSVDQSTSSLTISVGTKSLATSTALNYSIKQSIRLEYDSARYMDGEVISYDNATGALVLDVGAVQGAGTFANWTLRPLDRFGASLAVSDDGRSITVGAPNAVVDGTERAGKIYAFDRSVQRIIYGTEDSSVDFTVNGAVTAPAAVKVNNDFFNNQDTVTVNAFDSFTVSGSTFRIFGDLRIGDVLEFETNQFTLLQELASTDPETFASFGMSQELCSYNCSLYVGAPFDSSQVYRGGVVERSVNQSRTYGITTSTVINPVLTPGHTIRINNTEVAVPAAATLSALSAVISEVPNVTAAVTAGKITIAVANPATGEPGNLLSVLPGSIGTTFNDLGFDTYVFTQQILSPNPVAESGFGSAVSVNTEADQLAVSAPNGTMFIFVIFDNGATEWDFGATEFFSSTINSGAVYLYGRGIAANASVTNPDRFIFGQALAVADLMPGDQFGRDLDYRSGLLWIGVPGSDVGDSSTSDYGSVNVWQNLDNLPPWQTQYIQLPAVDIRLLNSVFLYDRFSSAVTEFLDFFNPLQGKILGAARQNIDYIGAIDPAGYNVGPARLTGTTWGEDHVGEIWWDTSSVRFLRPNQDTILYASRTWAQTFPGSSIDVYEWIVSDQPPANYTGEGQALNTLSYTVNSRLTVDGIIETRYFFWVRNTVDIAPGKSLSTASIAQYIQDPRATGIAYLAPIDGSTVALYNCESLIEAKDTILHVEFDKELTQDNVHVEYELVAEGRPESFISNNLYRKLQDSLCGVDTAGNLVPDVFLSPAERYGVQFRPRQSMFVDRFLALKNYIDRANQVLARFPIAETRILNLLESEDPIPDAASGQWNLQVATLEILGFQNIYAVPLGYRYLVQSDSSQRGLWTIYTVVLAEGSQLDSTSNRELLLTKVQNFRTTDYWSYIDWYQPGYNSSVKPVVEVTNFADLSSLTISVGDSAKVTQNAQGKFEIYLRTAAGYQRVGLEDGTIEISQEIYDYALGRFGWDVEVFDAQYFDQEPVLETRQIIRAINEELFVDDLLVERNRLLTLVFNFVLSETQAPEWLTKTSLIDVDHRIRELLPFQNYIRDNQEFVLDYLREVKPYHVQVREFNLNYFGSIEYQGDVVDFDLPAFFNTELDVPQYVSPILLPYAVSESRTGNNLSDTSESSQIWQQWPYDQWINNYEMTIAEIEVISGGSGFTEAPLVTIQGSAATAATARATINSQGQVSSVILLTAGSGYTEQPTVVFTGGNGSGATAYARLVGQGSAQIYNTSTPSTASSFYNLVRKVRTVLRFDRYQYQTSILIWSPNGTYENGTMVRYNNQVWLAANSDGSSANVGPNFRLEDWSPVSASQLSGVDRTQGFYVAGVDAPGLDLPLLIDGIAYPGVNVWGDYFTGNLKLDTSYTSSFTDQFLGTRSTDINVDGGEFIGLTEGHAPEELVNGSEFDTLDMRVITRPGSDWQEDGHGFQIGSVNAIYDADTNPEISWAGLVDFPFQVLVSNQTTGRQLVDFVDYQVDWEAQTVFPEPGGGISNGDLIAVRVFELGGGSQLYRITFAGEDVDTGVFYVPVNAAEIQEIAVFVDGVPQPGLTTWTPYIDSTPWNILQSFAFNSVVNTGGNYYRSLQSVPPGIEIGNTDYWLLFVPTLESEVTLASVPGSGTLVSVCVLGYPSVAADNLIAGRTYTITVTGNTDWGAVGAPNNSPGTVFVATTSGTGTGLASTNYSWSTPVIQTVESNVAVQVNQGFTLSEDVSGTNPANMLVFRNGLRLNPPAGIEWIGDGTSVSFGLPQRMGSGFSQASIDSINDVKVWVNDVLQTQSFGAFQGDYEVTPWTGSNVPGRQVMFVTPPPDGSRILISVATLAGYEVVGDFLELSAIPNLNDVFQVITWNDTSQQQLLTQVFVGPVVVGTEIAEGFDTTGFDAGSVSGDPGSFSYVVGSFFAVNNFVLDRANPQGSRLFVTLDGRRLFEGQDYLINGNEIELPVVIGSAQVLAVTQFTNSVVPEAAAFRIFQDMRGVQAVYRITPATSTTLASALSVTDSQIQVTDAAKLQSPDMVNGVFGVIMINGERITYTERDLATNVLSGLRRGTAGTAVSTHTAGSEITDIGRTNLLTENLQDYVVSTTVAADGSSTTFQAPNIILPGAAGMTTLEVYVGGERQYAAVTASEWNPDSAYQFDDVVYLDDGSSVTPDRYFAALQTVPAGTPLTDTTYWQAFEPQIAGQSTYRWRLKNISPVEIELDTSDSAISPLYAPAAGIEVTILQRRGSWWYDLSTVASRSLSLQESDTTAARFLTGRS